MKCLTTSLAVVAVVVTAPAETPVPLAPSADATKDEKKAEPPKTYLADWRTKMRRQVPRTYVCGRASDSLKIDGKLDDASWQSVPWTADFVDIEGDAKPAPRFRTRAKMLWDDAYFYIAAEMEEPHVWGTLTKHDSVIFHDPDFEVFIDPNGDAHDYYEFEMNALNTGWDLFLPKPYISGGSAVDAWEIPGLQTAVHVNGTLNDPSDRDTGWSVEIAIPWKVLAEHAGRAAPPSAGDQWRVGFSRVEWQVDIKDGHYVKKPGVPENNWIWSPQGVVDMHRPERWGYVQFTRMAPDSERVAPDVSAPARDALQEVFYAQLDFKSRHGRWGRTLEEIEVSPEASGALRPRVLLTTADGYECTVEMEVPGREPRRWAIRHDALFREVTKP